MEFCTSGIYKCKEPKKYYDDTKDPEYRFLYHCRNWTFTVYGVDNEGIIHLLDTYFRDKELEVNEQEFQKDFELVLDLKEFHKVDRSTNLSEFRRCDVRQVADCSAGVMNPSKYIRNGAKKDIDKMIRFIDMEIKSTERQLESLKERRIKLMKENSTLNTNVTAESNEERGETS